MLNQAKSVFLKKVEKRQAKSVFLFRNLRMSVISVQMLEKKFDIKHLRIFLRKNLNVNLLFLFISLVIKDIIS